MRLGKYLVIATVLLLAAPGVIATPAVATPDRTNSRAFKPGELAPAPAAPKGDPAIAERVARGKAAWESMTQQERERTVTDVQNKVTPEIQQTAAERFSSTQSASTLDQLSVNELAALANGTSPGTATQLADQGVSVTKATGQGARNEVVRTARDELSAGARGVDDDLDGLPADFEATVADQFTPGYIPSLTERPGTGFADFKDQPKQEVQQVYDSIPPRQHYRVKPLGFTTQGGQQYSWVRVDYLTLWNRDDGLASLISSGCLGDDMLDLFIGLLGLRPYLNGFIRHHPLDNERSIILAYAPTSGSQVNLNPAAYRARILYTAAHEEEPLFDNSYLVLIDDPANTHRILTETLQKHATYPFYPINGYPLLPPWVLAAAYAFIDSLYFLGVISIYTADFLYYLADRAYYGCIVERHIDAGLFWWPASAVNVGEPDQPAPGHRYIQDPGLRRKLEYPFFTTSEPLPDQRVATVAVNSSAYFPGQVPTYTVTGTPNSAVYWSSTREGASTGEVNAFYGQYTDAGGRWSGNGAPWGAGDVGVWTKSVKVGTQSATTTFSVLQTPPAVNTLQVVQNGKCLDSSVSTTDGVNPYMYGCVPSAANHQWLLEPLGSDTYVIRSLQNGMCLDSGVSTTDGVNPYMWSCVPTALNHQWRFEAVGSGTYVIRSLQTGKCLDSGVSTADGARPYMWTCVPTAPNHQWRRG